MSTTQTQWNHLERDPKSVYRQLSIKGRRIKARTLYGLFMNAEEPQTIEEIAKAYDLSVDVVKEAIAYCESDPPEIRQDFMHEEMIMQASGMNDPNYKFHGRPKPISPLERAKIRQLCYPSDSI